MPPRRGISDPQRAGALDARFSQTKGAGPSIVRNYVLAPLRYDATLSHSMKIAMQNREPGLLMYSL